MAHHSSEPPSREMLELRKRLESEFLGARDQLHAQLRREGVAAPGPTRRFTETPIVPEDEGETRVAIASGPGKVLLDFGSPTAWIGFNPDQADELAKLLRRHAKTARKRAASEKPLETTKQ